MEILLVIALELLWSVLATILSFPRAVVEPVNVWNDVMVKFMGSGRVVIGIKRGILRRILPVRVMFVCDGIIDNFWPPRPAKLQTREIRHLFSKFDLCWRKSPCIIRGPW